MPVAGAAIMTTRKSVSSNGTDCDLPNVFMAYTIPSIESLGHAHRVVRPCPQAHAPIPIILPLVHRGSESWPKSSGFAERETARQWPLPREWHAGALALSRQRHPVRDQERQQWQARIEREVHAHQIRERRGPPVDDETRPQCERKELHRKPQVIAPVELEGEEHVLHRQHGSDDADDEPAAHPGGTKPWRDIPPTSATRRTNGTKTSSANDIVNVVAGGDESRRRSACLADLLITWKCQ